MAGYYYLDRRPGRRARIERRRAMRIWEASIASRTDSLFAEAFAEAEANRATLTAAVEAPIEAPVMTTIATTDRNIIVAWLRSFVGQLLEMLGLRQTTVRARG